MAKPIVTGVVYRGGNLDYTSVRERSVLRRKPRSEEPGSGILFEDLKHDHSRLKGDIHYALPASKSLIRVVDLPSDDPEEIEGMAEMQIEKITPFPAEQLYIGTETLSTKDGSSRVLISAIQKKFVDHAGDSFKEAGLLLKRVDIDVLAWLELLRREDRLPLHGRHILLFHDGSGLEMVVLENGLPLWFRSLGVQEEESEEEFMEDMGEEMEYTLASLEGEWGSIPIAGVTIFHEGAPPRGLGLLGDSAGVTVSPQRIDSLPPLSEGIALRAAKAGEEGLDLAPLDWAEEESRRQTIFRLVACASALFAAWFGVIIGFGMYEKHVNDRIVYLEDKSIAHQPQVMQADLLDNNIGRLTRFHDRRFSSLEAFTIVVEKLPAKPTELTGFTYQKRNGKIRVEGVAPTDNMVNNFEQILNGIDLFEKVELNGIISRVTSGRHKGKWRFVYDCWLPEEALPISVGDEDGDS